MKRVKIIQPLVDLYSLPFLHPIYQQIQNLGYYCKPGFSMPKSKIPAIILSFILKVFSLPQWLQKKDVHLVFVCGWKAHPMCFPSAFRHEIIPIIWDCWPKYRSTIHTLLSVCNANIIFFTQQQNVEYFQRIFPRKKIFFIPEAIVTSNYIVGPNLSERNIDILEFGRTNPQIKKELSLLSSKYNYIFPQKGKHLFATDQELSKAISDAKIILCYPRSVTHPKIAGDIETLTQRYWECMYSGTLIIGQAPQELVSLLGYNPVIESPITDLSQTISKVLDNLNDYQSLANKNHESACKMGTWNSRLEYIEKTLSQEGYLLEKKI